MFVHWSWTYQNIIETHTWVGWLHFFFQLNTIPFACLLGSGLKLIFRWKYQSLIIFKSLLTSLAEVLASWATKNKEASSAKNLHSLSRPFGKSLTYIKNRWGPRMEPCSTPGRISTQDAPWPFKTTLCFLLVDKSFSIWIKSPHILFWRSLSISPACQTLSKAFEISRNNPRTSRPISKALKISWLMESSWLM